MQALYYNQKNSAISNDIEMKINETSNATSFACSPFENDVTDILIRAIKTHNFHMGKQAHTTLDLLRLNILSNQKIEMGTANRQEKCVPKIL